MGEALEFVDELLARVPVVELRYPLDPTTQGWLAETLTEDRW
jgi:hypothetical protein